jgi:hypothetical protein
MHEHHTQHRNPARDVQRGETFAHSRYSRKTMTPMMAVVPSLLAACAASCSQGVPVEVPAFAPLLDPADRGRWISAHSATASDVPWLVRPWQADLAGGVEQAWRENRPLLLWLEDGHPFGCATAQSFRVRETLHSPLVIGLLRSSVLAADDLTELIAAAGPAREWLERLLAGGRMPTRGIWICSPDGQALGHCDGTDPAAAAATLREAAEKWERLSAAAPDPPDLPGPLARSPRRADSFPNDGSAFEIVYRTLAEAGAGPPEAFEGRFNRDFLWLAAAECASLRPSGIGPSARSAWAPALARRLACAVLAEAADGRTEPWNDAEVESANVDLTTQFRRQGRTGVLISASFSAARGGLWENVPGDPLGAGTWIASAPDARAARARAMGWMEVDAKSGAILSFSLIALVQHWDRSGARNAAVLMRNLQAWEEGARFAPSRDAALAASLALHRVWFADAVPEVDGMLGEPAWTGAPWSGDLGAAGSGARAKLLWHADALYLAAWCTEPELSVELDLGGKPVRIVASESGEVRGVEDARAAVRSHGDGPGRARAFEIAIPWHALSAAAQIELPPAPGQIGTVTWRAGVLMLAERAHFEPSRLQQGSFGAGGGFR